MKTDKELGEIEKELTEDFIGFLQMKNDENIIPIINNSIYCYNNILKYGYTLSSPLMFYDNRINNLTFLWEKKLFDYLKSTYGGLNASNLYIHKLGLSPDVELDIENANKYDIKRSLLVKFWIVKDMSGNYLKL